MAGGNIGNSAQSKVKGRRVSLLVGVKHIYRNCMVSVGTDGYAENGKPDEDHMFMGMSEEEVDNSAGAAGAKRVIVTREGVFRIKKNTTSAQTDVGKAFFIARAQTATLEQTVKVTAGGVYVGQCVGLSPDTPDGTTYADDYLWIDIKPGAGQPYERSS